MNQSCPLCEGEGAIFYQRKDRRHFQCATCHGIFLDRALRLDQAAEIARYTQHNNDPHDPRYQAFVAPMTKAITRDFQPQDQGLDFGAGTGSAVSQVLRDRYFQIEDYDPLFHNKPQLLQYTYNYIACCEVMEHFYNPAKEFALLKKLLRPSGTLYCMTAMYDESIDFDQWYYKNDPTHVFLFHADTVQWIQRRFHFASVVIEGRLITFFTRPLLAL